MACVRVADDAGFRLEHRELRRDPMEFAERGQLFFTAEPGDPAPVWLSKALGPLGDRICGMATDYGHWDAQVRDCVSLATRDLDSERAVRLVSGNALDFYGERLRKRMLSPVAEAS